MNHINVSIVLNVHRESLYLVPTLLSLDECAIYAQEHGLNIELVIVFDRTDSITMETFDDITLSGFSNIQKIFVDVGSLGLARNAGIEKAHKEYIWTADADDLVSKNCILSFINQAERYKHKEFVIFVEYYIAFSDNYHNVRYFDSDMLCAGDFAFQHPYVSRLFAHKSVFSKFTYHDLRLTSGFAFEDWDINAKLFNENIELLVSKETIIFYRQRENSLLKLANQISANIIPHSGLFNINSFLNHMESFRKRVGNIEEFMKKRQNFFKESITDRIFSSSKLIEFIVDANRLEPEVDLRQISNATDYYPIPHNIDHWGLQLENLYKMIAYDDFTDILLLPWLNDGGAEKYILQILDSLLNNGQMKRLLVISGEPSKSHTWVNRLPSNAVFVDLYNSFPTINNEEQTLMLIRTLLAVHSSARLHLKASPFAHRMMDKFGNVLSDEFKIIYYRFVNDVYKWNNSMFYDDWSIKFLRKHLSKIDKVISDCNKIKLDDAKLFGALTKKYQIVYAQSEVIKNISIKKEPTFKLLWASRLCYQKRTELLSYIIKAIHQLLPQISIDVYGTIEGDYEYLSNISGLNIKGEFDGFDELQIEQYDAFIYTSYFDGLPNIILEAMSRGMVVIAPDIGGISEVIEDGKTGYLIQNHSDNIEMANRYANMIEKMYQNWNNTVNISQSASKKIEMQHNKITHQNAVNAIFNS